MAQKYAKMEGCPVKGCQDPLIITTGYKPTVVGVKRHVRHWHPDQYDKIDWPPIHPVSAGQRAAATIRGTKPRPSSGRKAGGRAPQAGPEAGDRPGRDAEGCAGRGTKA